MQKDLSKDELLLRIEKMDKLIDQLDEENLRLIQEIKELKENLMRRNNVDEVYKLN